ncbi:MAG: N-acetyltransferase [Paracoccus hibiscisoli]
MEKGIGSAFVEHVLEDTRRLGHRIVPLCPFARSQFQRFPHWWDVLERFT